MKLKQFDDEDGQLKAHYICLYELLIKLYHEGGRID